MRIFVKMDEKNRIKFFKSIKKEINSSWDKLYKKHSISKTMFFNYLSGKYNIPFELFSYLKEKYIKINIKYTLIKKEKYIEKEIYNHPFNIGIAELLGVLNGDGHISNDNNEICVVGNKLEKDYFLYLQNLFKNIFNINSTISYQDNHIKLRIYSRKLHNLLTQKYNLPKGNKKNKLKIPLKIMSSKQLIKAYIRGLFDTDGSFYIRREKDPVIEITSASFFFLKEIKELLNKLGFNVANGNKRLFIYRKKDIEKFFKEIKPSNNKHLNKYQNFMNNMSVGSLKAE
ncbi:MAG: LAGLIDADG family homing endonuclease [Nanoarchaeota archaeon]